MAQYGAAMAWTAPDVRDAAPEDAAPEGSYPSHYPAPAGFSRVARGGALRGPAAPAARRAGIRSSPSRHPVWVPSRAAARAARVVFVRLRARALALALASGHSGWQRPPARTTVGGTGSGIVPASGEMAPRR